MKKHHWRKYFFTAVAIAGMAVQQVAAQQADKAAFSNWPQGSSPQEVGKRVADHFAASAHQNFGKPTPPARITYPEVCTWYGALEFAKESKDKALAEALAKRFEPLFGEEAKMVPVPEHVDYTVFGAVPFELYIQTKQKKYLDMALPIANKQWGAPQGTHVAPNAQELMAKGYTWQTRLWIDDMFMITAVQVQAYRATGERKYIDRAAKEMVLYLDSLQRPNGLFYHAPDVPYFWGRVDGWVAVGMAEVLRSLPKNSEYRPRILEGYKKMMASLLQYQAPDGMWHQLIDDPEAWPETSSTAMFAFAMICGVKNGWLDYATYAPAARKAWLALVTYIDANADVREVCEGTNKKNDRQYYLDRKRNVGDMHGQAPVLWCAAALLRPAGK